MASLRNILAANVVIILAIATNTAFGKSVLHPNLKYFTVGTHPENGQPLIDVWSPSTQHLTSVERAHWVTQQSVSNKESSYFYRSSQTEDLVHDYVEMKETLTYSNVSTSSSMESQDYVVEIVLVCDKEFGDRFNHNREEILKYWTTYYWVLNMRFKTLPRSNISLLLTSIIVISKTSEQPFIEDARDEAGRVNIFPVLGSFAAWIWNQTDTLPKFDMAILASGSHLTGADGVAYLNGACRKNIGSLVYADSGTYSIATAAHEIGHNLGAPHDADEDYPGGCNYPTGYIMGGGRDLTRYHFSECSDRTIDAYLKSDQAACLKRIDEPAGPVISPEYSATPIPTMDEQCKRWQGADAVMGYFNCTLAICWKGSSGYLMTPMDDTPCFDTGTCFRGLCFPTTHTFIRNLESNNCILGTDRFSGTDKPTIAKCPVMASPLDQFRTIRVDSGYLLSVRYSTKEKSGDKSKCLLAPEKERGLVEFGPCFNGGRSQWDLVSTYFGEYLMIETSTGRCAKQEGDTIIAVSCGDRKNRSMVWKIGAIME